MEPDRERVLLSWSGGKDSCMALHVLRGVSSYEVAGLFTTVRREDGRVAMHGVSRELIERQAAALELPLTVVEVPSGASNLVYEALLAAALRPMTGAGLRTVAFGDLFLKDIRSYREDLMARLGISSIFPVWERGTKAFAREVIELGFEAIAVAVDPKCLDPTFAGRTIDYGFLADLPSDVDACGENGEYHTFVFAGPGFSSKLRHNLGQSFVQDGLQCREIVLT